MVFRKKKTHIGDLRQFLAMIISPGRLDISVWGLDRQFGESSSRGQRFFRSQPEPEKSLRTGEISFGREQSGREFDQSPVRICSRTISLQAASFEYGIRNEHLQIKNVKEYCWSPACEEYC